ncbi:hypothetical protein ACJJTC_001449 [Scirpophaga incertulas]
MDREAFLNEARAIDWSPVFDATTIDDQVTIFNETIIKLYDKHAPYRSIKVKHLPAPWLTDDIKSLLRRKAAAKAKYKCRATEYNREAYIKIRNRCNVVCRDALRRHIFNSVSDENPAKVWKFLKSLGIGKTSDEAVSSLQAMRSVEARLLG